MGCFWCRGYHQTRQIELILLSPGKFKHAKMAQNWILFYTHRFAMGWKEKRIRARYCVEIGGKSPPVIICSERIKLRCENQRITVSKGIRDELLRIYCSRFLSVPLNPEPDPVSCRSVSRSHCEKAVH